MIRHLLPIVTAACLTACTTPTTPTSRTSAIPTDRPVDFSMLITVLPTEADLAGSTDPADPNWLRPARYAVEPDGHLRAETGLGVSSPGFPPIARRLEPGEIDRIYALARQLRTGDEPIVPGVDVYEAPSDSRVALLEIGADGRFIATEHIIIDEHAEVAALIRELARLAWLDG